MKNDDVVSKIRLYMSALQKAIRWCEVNDARYFARELVKTSNHGVCFTRLKVIAAEDTGLADPTLLKYVWDCFDEFQVKKQDIKISNVTDYPELYAIIDRAVTASALSYTSRHIAMLTFTTLFDIHKKEDCTASLDDYKNNFRIAVQERDEKNAAYYAFIVGVFLKSENLLFEIVHQEKENRNRGLIDEWISGYKRIREGDKLLILAGIISLLCQDINYPHGEYIEQVSDCLSSPIEEARIPDRAYDMHTDEGKKMGRGLKHFFDDAASVRNERFPDDLEEKGKEMHFQAQKEGLKENDVIVSIKGRCSDRGGQTMLRF